MTHTVELPMDTDTLAALNRATKAKTEAEKAAAEKAAIDHKYKMMRETGYDQAWPNRRKTKIGLSGIDKLKMMALLAMAWSLIISLIYSLT